MGRGRGRDGERPPTGLARSCCSRVTLLVVVAALTGLLVLVTCWDLLPDVDVRVWSGRRVELLTSSQLGHEASSETAGEASHGREYGWYYGRPLEQIYDKTVPSTAWFNSSQCAHHRTWFAKVRSMDHLVYLASHPRSGNTWLRFIIEASTGVFTGSNTYDLRTSTGDDWLTRLNFTSAHYHEPHFSWANGTWPYKHDGNFTAELFQAGFLGELQNIFNQNVIVSKTHLYPYTRGRTANVESDCAEEDPNTYFTAFPQDVPSRRAILIVRDPFKVILSSRHYQFSKSVHVKNDAHPHEHFQGADWEEFVAYHAQHWLELNTRWLKETDEVLIVSYENLKADPAQQMLPVLGFLGVTPDQGRMACLRRHQEGGAHNRHHPVSAGDVFPRRLQFLVWTAAHQLQQELSRRRLPLLPLDSYSFQEFRYSGVAEADGAVA